jgi:nicotinamidase-related amidase
VEVNDVNKEKTGLIIIDAQENLMSVMRQKKEVIQNIVKLLHLARIYHLPVLMTEQYPKMLGPTVDEIRSHVPDFDPVEKLEFDFCRVEPFMKRLEALTLYNLIVTGVEAHVCVLQSCLCLVKKGYHVYVPRDCIDSRTYENKQTALELMKDEGVTVTSAEVIIFQMLKQAGTPEFKEMLKVIK